MKGQVKERYEASTKAQFEALGRFIQAFEHMVSAMRSSIEGRLQQESRQMVFFTRMLLHHSALTAYPLRELFRAVIYTDVNELRKTNPSDSDDFNRILSAIATEVSDLIRIRNVIIHGTQLIGWVSSGQEDFTELAIHKFGVSATGFKQIKGPNTAAEVLSLVDRCQRTERAIRVIYYASETYDQNRQNMKRRALDELAGRETPDSVPV